ncbi:MAG: hypothetical protein KDE14_03055 [Rhodobacteraceae bacterium]|nr:hypothetical protein [Paracoccaceae bacterium]
MTVYGIYTAKDQHTYLCELERTEENAFLPVFQVTLAEPRPPGSRQDFHVSRWWGGMQVVLAGELEIGVSAGSHKTAVGKAGDVFIFLDTHGDGHTAARKGQDLFRGVSFRFQDPWPHLVKAYRGWPSDIVPPESVSA